MCLIVIFFYGRYFGVCFLNQLIFSKRESDLVSKLVLLYFSFFKVSLLTQWALRYR